MTSTPHPLLELTKSRLRELLREPGALFWVFCFPLLLALGLGLAFRSRPPALPQVAVVVETAAPTEPGSPSAEELAQALLSSPQVEAQRLPLAEAEQALARAQLDLLVTLSPQGAQYRFDPLRETSPLARQQVDAVLQTASGRVDPLPTTEQLVTERGSRYIDFLLPGLIAMNLMGTSMWGIGYNLVVARKRRLLRRYAVTPMRRSHFFLSYFFSRAIFLVLELGLLLAFGAWIFDSFPQGNLLTLGLVSFLGAWSFAGISLIIGARLDNTETANGWMNFVQMPMWVLSGALFSYERFPEYLHPWIEILPLTTLVNALRALWNEGAGLIQLALPLGILTLWGLVGLLITSKVFRWQ